MPVGPLQTLHMEIITSLHARGVELAHNGYYEPAKRLFRQVLTAVKELQQGEIVETQHQRQTGFLRLFMLPNKSHTPQGPTTEGDCRLFHFFAVLVEDNRYAEVSRHDLAIFTATALYNVACSYHMGFLKRPRQRDLQHAERIYRYALNIVRAMCPVGHYNHQCTETLLSMALCNNLAAIYAETFQYQILSQCLDGLEGYITQAASQGVNMCFGWMYANFLSWRSLPYQHSSAA